MAGSWVIGGLKSVANLLGKFTSCVPYVNRRYEYLCKFSGFSNKCFGSRRTSIKNGRFNADASDNPDQSDCSSRCSRSLLQGFLFLLFRRQGPIWRAEACPSGSSQKIPALVLRVVTPRRAIPNDQSTSEASVMNLPFLMPARSGSWESSAETKKKSPAMRRALSSREENATQLPLVRVTLTVWPQKVPVTVAV